MVDERAPDGPAPEDEARLAEGRQLNTGRLLQRAARLYSARATEKLRERGHTGLSMAHSVVLSYVDMEGTRVTTLAERAVMTKQAMGQLVRELEEQGYLSRRPDPTDHRATLVQFTPAGWDFLRDAAVIKREIEDEFTAALGADALALLRASLHRLLGDPDENT